MASVFRQMLARHAADPMSRRWLYVPYDHLTDRLGPLACDARVFEDVRDRLSRGERLDQPPPDPV